MLYKGDNVIIMLTNETISGYVEDVTNDKNACAVIKTERGRYVVNRDGSRRNYSTIEARKV
ncbi:hypothetical protein vBYenM636_27 [Yersinia phage vB_YenM_636]|nr:hypothetical protein X1_30 [Yersinia phage vB_Yen_X1]QKN86278.1 hypothetical protein vBYenM12_27 [Yersinia phage vB_YenM_12]QKN86369.1 hypothetical protein vBYenM22_27 [Yersinia phage vB_YenM_22]QKN86460.1 hypothetical protein vBYenM25_27 [Yersinia phage vB_YenM_25]QKN86551.1 hypothetical protein vBYenM27_27 [Yersinia phage vB_YenM_27]QKN86642.1 hypothetical protein vBYenM39_27 [Yersinia phage vB_YenM_39]QKN86733.1 hypothetical protein vBYenM126_27 [Yersinia phage vB_YenM_126]QKN86824.1 h